MTVVVRSAIAAPGAKVSTSSTGRPPRADPAIEVNRPPTLALAP